METVDFLNVCENQTRLGRKIYVPDYLSSGKYPIVDQSKKYIVAYTNEDDGLYSDVPFVIFGDVTRVIKYIDFPCFLGADGSVIVKVINPAFNTKYVYYALLNSYIPDTGFNRHYKFLKDIKIKKYTLNEQEKIVSILDKINEAIKLERKRISLLDELIKSRFNEMFGDCKSVRKELGEISTVGSGDSLTAPSISEIKTPEYMYLVYGANGIRGYYKFANRHGKCVLVGRVGALAGNVHYYEGDFFATEHAIVIETTSKDVEPEWLSYELSRRNLFSISKGVAQPVISSSSLKKEIINIPDLSAQQQFVNFVHLIDKSKFKVQNRIESLTELLNKKMDEFFGGDD